MAEQVRVLLVEDDPVIGEATLLHLERHGYAATWVQDGLEAWESFTAQPPDLVVCDVMLPGIDGVTLCRRIRDAGTTPVVLVSARTDAIDIVGGLEAGADDYVTKPFDVQVLLARMRSVVRRSAVTTATPASGEEPQETYGDLTVDRRSFEVRRDGVALTLTPTEMRLLLELADAAGHVVSRSLLLERVWDLPDCDDAHLVNVHVQRLRGKVGAERIETVRGFGYKLRR